MTILNESVPQIENRIKKKFAKQMHSSSLISLLNFFVDLN